MHEKFIIMMWYVYIIKSVNYPNQIYIGNTSDLKSRFRDHNLNKSKHTSKYTPWEMLWYSAFQDKMTAFNFEAYLKSHSGRAFLRKRLIKIN